jgi:hypothetical protein
MRKLSRGDEEIIKRIRSRAFEELRQNFKQAGCPITCYIKLEKEMEQLNKEDPPNYYAEIWHYGI